VCDGIFHHKVKNIISYYMPFDDKEYRFELNIDNNTFSIEQECNGSYTKQIMLITLNIPSLKDDTNNYDPYYFEANMKRVFKLISFS
jgi:hypothetical protein